MNIKEYIESGILEAYVLGSLTEQERASVEADMVLYPELADEVEAIEMAMQLHANETSVTPPAFMQEQIWNAIKAQQSPANKETVAENPTAKVVEFTPPAAIQRPAWQRAAVWAAVIVSVLTNFMLLSQRNKIKQEQAAMAARVDSMQGIQQQLLAKAEAYNKGMDMLADTSMKTIVMRSALPGHEMTGMVFWSKTKGDTYLAIHNMPMPEKGKQYQLWVIQDGKPVSMGVIDNDLVANAGTMFKVPMNITGGQAFAISLEKEGGNPTPTEVMVVGAI